MYRVMEHSYRLEYTVRCLNVRPYLVCLFVVYLVETLNGAHVSVLNAFGTQITVLLDFKEK